MTLGGFVQYHGIGKVVGFEGLQVGQVALLGVFQVKKNGSGRPDTLRHLGQAVTAEGVDPKVFFQEVFGPMEIKVRFPLKG